MLLNCYFVYIYLLDYAEQLCTFFGEASTLRRDLQQWQCLQAVDESLRSVNLLHGGAPDKQVKKYSGGMRRRLSVAISLIGDAKVLLPTESHICMRHCSFLQEWTWSRSSWPNWLQIVPDADSRKTGRALRRHALTSDTSYLCLRLCTWMSQAPD